MKHCKLLFLFILICAFPSIAQAQEKDQAPSEVELEKTVVTATRTETPIVDLPVSVTVITKDDINKMSVKTVDDVLNNAAGINVRRCKGLADTGHTTIGMRGLGRDTSRILFLKDGIPLNNTYTGSVGNFWDVMSVDDIEKIEIVRGASSALYGSSAMGGVINIITRPATKKIAGGVSFEGGTFDSYIANARFSGATDRFGLRVAAGYKTTDGYEYYKGDKWKDYYETPEAENTNASVGADIWIGESLLKLDYTYFHQHSLTRTSTEYDGHKDTNEYSLNYSLPIGKTDLSVKSYYFDYSTETESRKYNSTTGAYDRFYYDYDIPRDDWGLMLEASTELGSHRVTVGTDLKWGKCDSRYTYATGKRDFGGKQDLYSLYVNDDMFAGDKVVLSAGLRYDYWKNHDADFYDDTTDKPYSFPYPDKNDDAWSPKAGVVYKVREDTRLRTSFGTGFKAPSLYNLYRSGPHGSTRFDLANPGLGPEKMTWSYDAGFDMEPNDNLSLTLTWYQSSFKDFLGDRIVDPDELPPYIPPDQFDPDMAIIQKVNMGKIDIYGVEAGFEVAFNSKWSAFVNHTYNVSKIKKYEEAPEDEGNYLSYCPKNVTKIGFIYDNPDWFTLGIYLTNVGSHYTDFKNSDEKKLEGYQVIDMKILREIFKGMEVFLSLDNVTDEDYSEYRSATTITYCPPFTAMLGVKYDF